MVDGKDIAIGIGLVGLGAIAFKYGADFMTKLGLYAYNGLTVEQVRNIATEMDNRAKILSRVQGGDGVNHIWYRGIYLGGELSYPLYYRYDIWPKKNQASYKLYPMLFEQWSTQKDLFGTSGSMVFPAIEKNTTVP